MPAAEPADTLVPAENTYEVIVPIDSAHAALLRDGLVGRASILTRRCSLGYAGYLWLITTLRQDIRL